ncbi:MAG: tRNA1(Val) (adenine(37)-N6)-methyltransferase [Eubacteriales bacterium]
MTPDRNQETIEDLQYKGLKIIQNKACFCFGMDAVLLSSYVRLRRGDRVLDFCTGSGIVPILLSGQNKAKELIGIELLDYIADMGMRSVALNGLEDKLKIIKGDVKKAHQLVDGVFDVITVNPPYEKENEQRQSPNDYLKAARHEVHITFKDICKTANRMLKCGGRLTLVQRVVRLPEMMSTMRAHNLEPKRMRLVHSTVDKPPILVLLEAVKDGREGLKVDPPLIVRTKGGEYTKEIDRIYHRDEE